jgi:hypothetical protein
MMVISITQQGEATLFSGRQKLVNLKSVLSIQSSLLSWFLFLPIQTLQELDQFIQTGEVGQLAALNVLQGGAPGIPCGVFHPPQAQ